MALLVDPGVSTSEAFISDAKKAEALFGIQIQVLQAGTRTFKLARLPQRPARVKSNCSGNAEIQYVGAKIRLDVANARRSNQCGDLRMKWLFIVAVLVVISIHSARATELDCVSTTFNALSPNDKVCVSVPRRLVVMLEGEVSPTTPRH